MDRCNCTAEQPVPEGLAESGVTGSKGYRSNRPSGRTTDCLLCWGEMSTKGVVRCLSIHAFRRVGQGSLFKAWSRHSTSGSAHLQVKHSGRKADVRTYSLLAI
eukprot:1137111-Pelagomonas_calceolata.AAC.5